MKPHRKISKSNHPIDEVPQEILAGIGAIIAWWGYLQFQLGVIVREFFIVRDLVANLHQLGNERSLGTAQHVPKRVVPVDFHHLEKRLLIPIDFPFLIGTKAAITLSDLDLPMAFDAGFEPFFHKGNQTFRQKLHAFKYVLSC